MNWARQTPRVVRCRYGGRHRTGGADGLKRTRSAAMDDQRPEPKVFEALCHQLGIIVAPDARALAAEV